MNETLFVQCPYCGESIAVEPELIDEPVEYVEDCHICCRPIILTVIYSEDGSQVGAKRENE